MDIVEKLKLKFTSSNDVIATRASITLEEYNELTELIDAYAELADEAMKLSQTIIRKQSVDNKND